MLLLASALASPLASMECSSIADLDAAVGYAGVIETLVQEFPDQAQTLGRWTLPGLQENGVDVGSPTRLDLLADDDGTHLLWELGLADAAAFQDFGKQLVGGRVRQGQSVSVRTAGDRGFIEFVSDEELAELAEGPMDLLLGLADSDPGCVLAVGLADTSQLDGRLAQGQASVLVQVFRDRPDEIAVFLHSTDLPGEVDSFEGERPVRRRRATGDWHPTVTGRLNLDLEPLFEQAAEAAMVMDKGEIGEALTALDESGLVLASGTEIAAEINIKAGSFRVLAAVPLKRPRRARAVVRRLAKEPGAGRYDRGVLEMSVGGTPIFIGSRGRHLLVGTGWQDVMDATHGRGDKLVTHRWAREPGVFVGLRQLGLLDSLGPTAGLPDQQPSDEGAAMLVNAEEGVLSLRLSLPGLTGLLQQAALEQARILLAPELDLTLDLPPSPTSEPLAVLMLIRESQLRAIEQDGAPVPYAGGPRTREQLNADKVPWEGIPGTDFSGTAVSCRYEVEVVELTWSALAICDEDADGEVALYMSSNERLPMRLSPGSIR